MVLSAKKFNNGPKEKIIKKQPIKTNSKQTNVNGKKAALNKKKTSTKKKTKTAKKVNRQPKQKAPEPTREEVKGNRQDDDSTCTTSESTVTDQCLSDAMISLIYEKKQVTNYLKQSSQLTTHQKVSSNKLNKSGDFLHAAEHMLWAIGGNLSNPLCGANQITTNSTMTKINTNLAVYNYEQLMNCSIRIEEACNISRLSASYNHSDHAAEIEVCEALKTDFKAVSKECISQKDQSNGTLQCECWAKAAADVKAIKENSCETNSQKKIVTQHKNACVKEFGVCKRFEDDAVELIYKCMNDHSNKFINLTKGGLHTNLLRDLSRNVPVSLDTFT